MWATHIYVKAAAGLAEHTMSQTVGLWASNDLYAKAHLRLQMKVKCCKAPGEEGQGWGTRPDACFLRQALRDIV